MSEVVPEGWEEVKSGNIFEFNNGKAFYTDGYSNNGYRVIDLLNIDLSGKFHITGKDKFVSSDVYAKYPKAHLQENDLIIIMTDITPSLGLIGKTAVIDKSNSYVLNQRVGCLRPKGLGTSIKFMNYMFNSDVVRLQVVANTLGTAQYYVNTPVLKNLDLPLPPLPEQQKIAAILTSVDNVIESTQAQISKLQDLKTGMMQELLTKGIGHTEFKDSPVGRIPVGWDLKNLTDVAHNLDSKRVPIKSADRSNMKGEYRYYGASGVIDYVNDYIFDGEYILLGEDGENVLSRNLPLAFIVRGRSWVNNHAHVMQPKDGIEINYLCSYLESMDYTNIASGSAQPKITQGALNKLMVPVPSYQEQKKIGCAIDSVDRSIFEMKNKLGNHMKIKKALMQDLLTGKVRVKVNQ